MSHYYLHDGQNQPDPFRLGQLKEKYNSLKEESPSVIRNSLLMFLYRIIGALLGIVLIVLGICMLISSTAGYTIMSVVMGENETIKNEQYSQLSFFAAIVIITIGILCLIISRLANKLIRRNIYIMELEEVMDEHS